MHVCHSSRLSDGSAPSLQPLVAAMLARFSLVAPLVVFFPAICQINLLQETRFSKAFIKPNKTKAYLKRLQVKYKRRRAGKTDSWARIRLTTQDEKKYNTPKYRFVVRFAISDTIEDRIKKTVDPAKADYAAIVGVQIHAGVKSGPWTPDSVIDYFAPEARAQSSRQQGRRGVDGIDPLKQLPCDCRYSPVSGMTATNKDIVAQISYATLAGDIVLTSAYAHELPRYGLKGGRTNYAAAYCSGILLARRHLKNFELDEECVGNEVLLGSSYLLCAV